MIKNNGHHPKTKSVFLQIHTSRLKSNSRQHIKISELAQLD